MLGFFRAELLSLFLALFNSFLAFPELHHSSVSQQGYSVIRLLLKVRYIHGLFTKNNTYIMWLSIIFRIPNYNFLFLVMCRTYIDYNFQLPSEEIVVICRLLAVILNMGSSIRQITLLDKKKLIQFSHNVHYRVTWLNEAKPKEVQLGD